MPPPYPPIQLPSSYTSYANSSLKQLRLHHNPPSSSSPTRVVTVELYRPKNRNAFTDTMMTELETVFSMLSVDDRVKCIILTGSGSMFCAGADLEEGFKSSAHEGEREHRDGGGRAALAIHHCLKPTIVALNGSAVGVGITMTLPSTIRLAVKSAKIGFVFTRRGLVSEGASSYFLPRLIGYSRALHVVTTGAVYRADHKLLDGLFSETFDTADQVRARALELAEEIVMNTSAVSNVLVRELIWRGPGSAEEAHLLDSRVLKSVRGSRDNDEGVRSFMEKRPAKFEGTMTSDAPSVYPWWTPVELRNRPKAAVGEKPKL